MSDAAALAGAVREVLLLVVSERAIAPGLVADISRRVADEATARGVPADDLLELADLGSRR